MATPTILNATQSGNNTATSSWSIAFPAASTGDLIVVNIGWDDATNVETVTPPTGPNGETFTKLSAEALQDPQWATRSQVLYTVATGSWSAGNLTFTPSASEQWSAISYRVASGDFDSVIPIWSVASSQSLGSSVSSPAFLAGSTDGGGRLVWFATVDTDPLLTLSSGWTEVAKIDRGSVAVGLASRDSAITNSESITSGSWTISSDSAVSFGYIIRESGSSDGWTLTDVTANNTAWGYQDGSGYTSGGGQMYLPASKATWGNLLFTLGIPQGATIQAAKMVTYERNSSSNWAFSDTISLGAEQVDDATILGAGDYTTRYNDYSTLLNWVPESLGVITFNTPIDTNVEIKSVLQQIVNRAGWAATQDVGILLVAPASTFSGSWYDHVASAHLRPRLMVLWSASASQSLTVTGIASAESVSSSVVSPGAVDISSTGIESLEAVGAATVLPGEVSVFPTGVASVESVSSVTLAPGGVSVLPVAVVSGETIPSPSVITGSGFVIPTSIVSAEVIGSPQINVGPYTLFPTAIPSQEVYGNAVISSIRELLPTAIPSSEAFGGPVVSPGVVVLLASSVTSLEAFGPPTLTPGPTAINVSGLPSAEVFGVNLVSLGGVTLIPSSISGAESFGSSVLSAGGVSIGVSSIAPQEAFGNQVVQAFFVISPSGVESLEAFPSPVLSTIRVLTPTGITSLEEFGGPVIGSGGYLIQAIGIASEFVSGTPALSTGAVALNPSGVVSLEQFPPPEVSPGFVAVLPSGIGSLESFGSSTVDVQPDTQTVLPLSVPSEEIFGALLSTTGEVLIFPAQIGSLETFGVTDVLRDGDEPQRVYIFVVGKDHVKLGA